MIALVRIVRHADEYLVDLALGVQQLRYVGGKAEVAARVGAGVGAVHPNPGALVHGAEVQQDPALVEAFRQHQITAVPEVLPRFERPAHARELGLRRKGHDYLSVKLLRLLILARYGVFPGAVEV